MFSWWWVRWTPETCREWFCSKQIPAYCCILLDLFNIDKNFPSQVTKTQRGCWNVGLPRLICTTWTAELSALGAGCALPQRKLLGTYFCQRLSGFQVYWKRALENSKAPYRESNTKPSILWCSASTNCAPTPSPKRNRNTSNNIKESPCLVKKYLAIHGTWKHITVRATFSFLILSWAYRIQSTPLQHLF